MANPLYTLDFSPLQSGIEYYRQASNTARKEGQFRRALEDAQAAGVLDPNMMALAGSMGPEHGPNALFQAYNHSQQRDMMMGHYRAQEAIARANQAHQNATLAETRRYHDASIGLARDRMNMLDSRVRDRYGLGADEGGGARPMSDDGVGIDPQGGFYIKPRATPAFAPAGPSIGAMGQGRAPLPADRIEEQGSFTPTSGETPMPGVSVGPFHPGSKALARQEAQQILDTTDLARLDPKNPQHNVVIQKLGDAFGGGKLQTGKRWTLDPNHRLVQEDIPGATKLTAGERTSAAMAKMGLDALDYAQPILVGSTDGKGNTDPKGTPASSGMLSRYALGPTTIGGKEISGGFGETGRAFKAMESAVMDLNFYLSGKSVSDKERQTFMKIYMPQTTDSADTLAWKHDRLRRYFKIVQSVRDGVPDGDVAIQDATRAAIQEGMAKERQGASRKDEYYSSAESALQEARDAIAKGAPREQVWKRLKQNGIDPGKL